MCLINGASAGWDLGDLLPRWLHHRAKELASFHVGFSTESLELPHNMAAGFQEPGSRSCQFLKDWVLKLAQGHFYHISAS